MEVKTKLCYRDKILNRQINRNKDLLKEYALDNKELSCDRIDELLEGNATSNFKPFVEVKLDDIDEVATGGGGGGAAAKYAPRHIKFSDYLYSDNMDAEVKNIDTSNIESFYGTFYNTQGVSKLDLSSWNTSSCMEFSYMFDGSWFDYIDMSNFTFESASMASYMFQGCSSLTTVVLGAGWLDLAQWHIEDIGGLPGGVGGMGVYLFDGADNLENIYVPDELVDSFKEHEVFSQYSSLIKPKSQL